MSGEEIYFNTALPKALGSWASEGEALNAIGAEDRRRVLARFLPAARLRDRQADLAHLRRDAGAGADDLLWRELISLPAVLTATPRSRQARAPTMSRSPAAGAAGDLVAAGVLKPLNAKLGQTCFALGPIAGDAVTLVFDKQCGEAPIFSRHGDQSAGWIYVEPPGRQKAVIRDPDVLRKLSI
jgi:hypothetical protein